MEGDCKSLVTEEALCCVRLLLEADWREEEELEEVADRLRGLVATRGRWWQFATLATLRRLTLLLSSSSSSISVCLPLLKTPILPSLPTCGSDLFTA